MGATVAPSQRIGKYPAPDAVQIVADVLGKPRSVAAQMLKPSDDRCPVVTLARMVAALIAKGRPDVAARLCLPLDIVRAHVQQELTTDLIADSQRSDLLEDLAESEALAFPSLESKRRWLSKIEAAHLKDGHMIVALRAECAA